MMADRSTHSGMRIQMILWIVFGLAGPVVAEGPHQATGVKVGEVTDTSAIVWMRVTAGSRRNGDGRLLAGRPARLLPPDVAVETLAGECRGAAGRVRLRCATDEGLVDARVTAWVDVSAESDFAHQFVLAGLRPGTEYFFSADTSGPGGVPTHVSLTGRFRTAPQANDPADVTFTVITGQYYGHLDHDDGFEIYEAMATLKPDFVVPTGDTIYYDSESPRATTVSVARYHWHRMYSLPRHVAFHRRVPGYWEKDDHDTLSDDCWPAKKPAFMLPMTFEKGQRIFREQVPMGEKTYRTYRWGKGLQIWLVEGRDFRSPNTMRDGPEKTIWGSEQKRWLKETLLASDADWKVLISPTPIVGPDRKKKADNHANAAFAHEGHTFRRWAADHLPDHFFIVCGDRHWQYHSVDPQTGVQEFSCGPASDEHASGTPGENDDFHRFHRVQGGFLSVHVGRKENKTTIVFRHHDVSGNVVYAYRVKK